MEENSEYQERIKFRKQRLQIFKELGDRQAEGEEYKLLAQTYHDLKDYQLSIEHGKESLSIAKEIGNR